MTVIPASRAWTVLAVRSSGESPPPFEACESVTPLRPALFDSQTTVAVFDSPLRAVAQAVVLQRAALAAGGPVRCGLALGAVRPAVAGLGPWGPTLGLAAGLARQAAAGQILAASQLSDRCHGLPDQIVLSPLGEHRYAGLGLQGVWQVHHPALPRTFAAAAATDRNLPLPPAHLVGREAWLHELEVALATPERRLVAVCGAGGLGKSRAVLHLAEQLAAAPPETCRDGVLWLDGGALRTTDALVMRLARALGLELQPQPAALEQVLAALQPRRCLLVIDQADDVPGVADVLERLLSSAPGLTVALTAVKPPTFAADNLLELPGLSAQEGLDLLVGRATEGPAGAAELVVDEVSELVNRLAGVPLAIELAAARVGAGGLPRVAQELGARLAQTRAPTPAEAAVRAALDWSYDLLPPSDRTFLTQLGAFAAEVATDDLEIVCDTTNARECVDELQQTGLLAAGATSSGRLAQVLLCGSVRAYAARLLTEHEAESRVRQRHARHFLRLADERLALLDTRREAAALTELEGWLAELQVALAWAVSSAQGDLAARLALALHHIWYRRGNWPQAGTCLELGWNALSASERAWAGPADPWPRLRAALAYQRAALSQDFGQSQLARQFAEVCLGLRTTLGEPLPLAEALNLLATLAIEQGQLDEAEHWLYRALETAPGESLGLLGKVIDNLAWVAARKERPELARQIHHRSLIYRRVAGDDRGRAATVGNLGVLAQDHGELDLARRHYLDSLALRAELRDRHGLAVMLHNLGETAVLGGQPAQAVALFHWAEHLFRELHSGLVAAPQQCLAQLTTELGASQVAEWRAATVDWSSAAAAVGYTPEA